MARPDKIRLEVKDEVGVGQAAHVFRLREKFVQVHGEFDATVQVEGTIEGGTYFPIGEPVTEPGVVAVPETVEFVRVRTEVYLSGEPKAVLAGFDARSA